MVALGEGLYGFRKSQALDLHQKVEHSPACSAPKAMIETAIGADGERWGLFTVKRAEADEVASRAPQADMTADDFDDIGT